MNTSPTSINQSESTEMNDRCLFLQDEITIAFVDDFFVLPCEPILGNIYQGLNEATERHDLMFQYTH